MMHALAAGTNPAGVIAGVLIYILAVAAYFAPAVVAVARKVPNAGSVIVIDLLLGWTVIGWIVALAMACRDTTPRYPGGWRG